MTFNSLGFIFFVIWVLIFYHTINARYKWIVGLVASIGFYGLFSYMGLIILFASTLADYLISIRIGKGVTQDRKILLVIGITLNIIVLFLFKYLNLLNETLIWIVNAFAAADISYHSLNIVAPVGISFISFKKVSYLIDCYRDTAVVEANYFKYLAYVSNFLQILSGPIDRATALLPQLKSPRRISWKDWQHGLILILTGFFMKLVIADRLSIYTDAVFNNIGHHYGMTLMVSAYFYAFQLYADFAGYTNVAIGCGYLLGLKFHPNFNLPYFSDSISDFWRRWHMTLSYWFRDYLYIPLGGNRVSRLRRIYNVMLVFFLTGLWHGANWTFIVWGMIHGTCICFEITTQNSRNKLYGVLKIPEKAKKTIRVIITFHLVTLAWIFFRANSIDDALIFFKHLFLQPTTLFVDSASMVYGLMGIIILVTTEFLLLSGYISYEKFENYNLMTKSSILYLLLFSIILCGVGSESAFIYYQF